ncbi:MAG: alpha/beta hydrolase, partial [Dehalococcoidia bacterium]|nr:alpha/beta hydrolase [Dehalococcoidia bacterium]
FTPALIVRGECDFMPWSITQEHRESFRRSRVVLIPNGGHFLLEEQPRPTLDTVAAFLADRPLPIPEYTGLEAPPQR